MAIYEYVCPRCGHQFEVMRAMSQSDEPAICPRCGARAEKLVSNFGSKTGFYVQVPEKAPFRRLRAKTSRGAAGEARRRKK